MSLLSYSSSTLSCKMNVIPNSNTIHSICSSIITDSNAVIASSFRIPANSNTI